MARDHSRLREVVGDGTYLLSTMIAGDMTAKKF
jgi:hypothetical protein